MGRKKCKTCGGTGKVVNPKYKKYDHLYFFEPKDFWIKCPDCDGSGERKRHSK